MILMIYGLPTGEIIGGQQVFDLTITMQGMKSEFVFCIVQAMQQYPELEEYFSLALQTYSNAHDKENCPYCNKAKSN